MEQTIITAFEQFAAKHGRFYNEFYVGIAADPVDRLTYGHQVDASSPHIYSSQPLHTISARAIEKYFLEKGAKGGSGGGDDNTCHIYMYKITASTRE